MSTKEITVKMAKPSEKDFDTVLRFLQGLDEIHEYAVITNDDGDDQDMDDPEKIVEWVESKWPQVVRAYSRVLWAGKTAIDNACDPTLDVLEFKPEILEAMKIAAEVKARRERLSQAHVIGLPAPKTWDDYERGCLATFSGGHHEEATREAFRHGMQTVFNLLRSEFPPAEEIRQ